MALRAYGDIMVTSQMHAGKRNGKHQIWIATEGGEAVMMYNRTDVYYRSIQGHGIAKLKVRVPDDLRFLTCTPSNFCFRER
jgi:hypothetical protein